MTWMKMRMDAHAWRMQMRMQSKMKSMEWTSRIAEQMTADAESMDWMRTLTKNQALGQVNSTFQSQIKPRNKPNLQNSLIAIKIQ